ncbi:response regulator [Myxococcota bacterium]|nr:response regulator [Myxococcota bacterium]
MSAPSNTAAELPPPEESCSCDAHDGGGPSKRARPVVRRILLADDDPVYSLVLRNYLTKWGYEVEHYTDGERAWAAVQRPDAPKVLIVDWVMPGVDGIELCRRVRALGRREPTFILMLTGRDERDDIVAGLEAGADDYVAKPAHREELRVRILNGVRTVELQLDLARRIDELETALANVKQLQGLLPICAYCKKVRSDDNYWQQVEAYFVQHSEVRFSHGICPDCYDEIVEPQLRDLDDDDDETSK